MNVLAWYFLIGLAVSMAVTAIEYAYHRKVECPTPLLLVSWPLLPLIAGTILIVVVPILIVEGCRRIILAFSGPPFAEEICE